MNVSKDIPKICKMTFSTLITVNSIRSDFYKKLNMFSLVGYTF